MDIGHPGPSESVSARRKNNWSLLSYLTWHVNLFDFCFDEHSNIKALADQICFVSFGRQVETFPYHAFRIALQCLKVT